MKVSTKILHQDAVPATGFLSLAAAVHPASTVVFSEVEKIGTQGWEERSGYIYGLHGTPTTFSLEQKLVAIEGGKFCTLFPSGLSAAFAICSAFLRRGDTILMPDNIYSPNRDMMLWFSELIGFSVVEFNPLELSTLANALDNHAKIIWVENPGSVTLGICDLPMVVQLANKYGCLVVLDSTWSAGLAYSGIALGAHIVLQALSKYQSGGSDLCMGAAILIDTALHKVIANTARLIGNGVSSHDCSLVHRGLNTLQVRFEKHQASARIVAEFLQNQPMVTQVYYPGLDTHENNKIWRRDFTGAGGLLSFSFSKDIGFTDIKKFVNSLKLFKIGFGWGGAHSLCMLYTATEENPLAMNNHIIRLFIGLEDIEDIVEDILGAFRIIQGVNNL